MFEFFHEPSSLMMEFVDSGKVTVPTPRRVGMSAHGGLECMSQIPSGLVTVQLDGQQVANKACQAQLALPACVTHVCAGCQGGWLSHPR